MRVEGSLEGSQGHPLAKLDGAEAAGEHELDLAAADLLVELHGGEELFPLRGVQVQAGGQAGAMEDGLDAGHLGRGQVEDLGGEFGGGDLADGDCFAV